MAAHLVDVAADALESEDGVRNSRKALALVVWCAASLALVAQAVPARAHGSTDRVRVGSGGGQGNGGGQALSANGSFVAFSPSAVAAA